MKLVFRWLLFLGAIHFSLYSLEGCRGKETSLYEENKELKLQITNCEEEIERLSNSNDKLKQANKDFRERIAGVRSVEDGLKKRQNLANQLEAELKARKVDLEDIKVGSVGELVLDEMIFQPGKAEISVEGRAILKQVASILQERKENIRVDGHTDSDPIDLSRDLWSSNWELSAIRASRVAECLEEYGVPAGKISVAAFGKTRPVASNDTSAGKKANRRVEILLYNGLDASASE